MTAQTPTPAPALTAERVRESIVCMNPDTCTRTDHVAGLGGTPVHLPPDGKVVPGLFDHGVPADAVEQAPALTDEQIDNMAGTFCDAYLRTLPPFGHPVGKDLFHRWYAAVVARAKREAAEEIAQAIEAVNPVEWALAGQYAGRDAAVIARQIGATR